MRVLAIDIGSSSVRAAILTGPDTRSAIAKVSFPTTYAGDRAEVDANVVLESVAQVIAQLGAAAKQVDMIAPAVMAPSWVAIARDGTPLTPLITHQDRRSLAQARAIESRIGKDRHLQITGNRSVPGGISSTTWAWHLEHAPHVLERTDVAGHLGTLLCHAFTGQRVCDPSNAGFMGLYDTANLSTWSEELIDAIGIDRRHLPRVHESHETIGTVHLDAARLFGLREGTPMLAGCMDGSAAALAGGAAVGQITHASGSTDVLAICCDTFRPHENLLTRPLGTGRKWLSVNTLAAAGTALDWLHRTLFSEMPIEAFRDRLNHLTDAGQVTFDARLGGSRTSVEPITAHLRGLTLGTTREQIAHALLLDLAQQSGQRWHTFRQANIPWSPRVLSTGGIEGSLGDLLRRDWPSDLTHVSAHEATLTGLWTLATR